MTKAHLKRIALPRTWSVPRKARDSKVFVSRPNPGKMYDVSLSINTFLKELVHLVETKREVKEILRYKHVFVNGTLVRDEKFPVGLFDVVSIEETKQQYRLTLAQNGKLKSIEIDAKEKDSLIKRVEGKSVLPKKVLQLNLFGSHNIRSSEKVNVGDSVIVKNKKIEKVLPLEKSAKVMLIAGRHCGKIGTVVDLTDRAVFLDVDGNTIQTLRKYAYPVGTITVR